MPDARFLKSICERLMSIRWVAMALGILLLLMQYVLWFGQGGLRDLSKTRQSLSKIQQINQRMVVRNQQLSADIVDLQTGQMVLQNLAREDLGMVQSGETFYRLVVHPAAKTMPVQS